MVMLDLTSLGNSLGASIDLQLSRGSRRHFFDRTGATRQMYKVISWVCSDGERAKDKEFFESPSASEE